MAAHSAFPGAAPPLLAYSLLHSSEEHIEHHAQKSPTADGWNLKPDIDKGAPLIPGERSLFAPGRVVGISGLLPPAARQRQSKDEDAPAVRNWVFESSSELEPTTPQAFIIQFYRSRAYTPEYLFRAMQSKLPEHPADCIQTILDTVKIFRAFNLDEILEAIFRISDILHAHKPHKPPSSPTLLLLEGLDDSLEEIRRTSSTLAAQAKLIPLLRTLTTLSRTHATYLTVVVVNSILLPTTTPSPPAPRIREAAEQKSRELSTPQEGAHPYSRKHHHQNPHLSVQSIFSTPPTPLQSEPPPEEQDQKRTSQPAISYSSSVSRSLDQGFDTHLLVSKKENRMIIEVAKDRMGNDLGRWCAL
ncbi:hypothetical protein PRK78_000674 [Emydomyces testavorans]|uniref:Uncharacterized protein n=1 Tax=Emydomyces testavorans TaxID=2070801 RepID=A0AAF0DBK5_9EURO|nr:hypothetical protein PRK78_000674 [Emydomyces testavorans]